MESNRRPSECFPGTASKFFIKLLVIIPVAPIITGILLLLLLLLLLNITVFVIPWESTSLYLNRPKLRTQEVSVCGILFCNSPSKNITFYRL